MSAALAAEESSLGPSSLGTTASRQTIRWPIIHVVEHFDDAVSIRYKIRLRRKCGAGSSGRLHSPSARVVFQP
jgi:hypothetical protein